VARGLAQSKQAPIQRRTAAMARSGGRESIAMPLGSWVMMESLLHAIVETAVDGIIVMDSRGTVTMFNPACERMFGYAAAEILDGDVKQLMPSPYRDEHDQYLENFQSTGVQKIIGIGREVVGRRKSGEPFPMDLAVAATEMYGKTFYIGILRDISERKRASDLRERLIEHLTASNEERAHFAHVASHDMREPLRMIAAFCGLLERDYGERLDARGREYLSMAVTGAKQMHILLDDLVTYGQLGLDQGSRSWFEADVATDQAIETINEVIRESGAAVTRGPLPRILGNPVRFNRLIRNLVSNALKYVAPDVQPRVHVSAERTGEFWTFAVTDNGIGIEPRHRDQIFEPFKRLHPNSRYVGTGLGLAICRKIVDGFEGQITVQAGRQGGSTFVFTVRAYIEGDNQ
jgi:two-component system sensor kinase FixL